MDELTAVQLAEWEAYDRLDPIGGFREDFHMAYLAMLITNTARAIHGKKGVKMDTVLDHMPKWDEETFEKAVKKQSVEEMKEYLLRFAKQHNKALERRNRKSPPINKAKQ